MPKNPKQIVRPEQTGEEISMKVFEQAKEPTTPVVAEKKNVLVDKYVIGTMATQTEEVILEANTEQPLDDKAVLVLILNKLDRIEKALM
jgi:hypothetical protein